MIIKEIINNTPYTIKFELDHLGKKVSIGSKGIFDANHNYSKKDNESVLRIITDPNVQMLAFKAGFNNFVLLEDIYNNQALCNFTHEEAIRFRVVSGFGEPLIIIRRDGPSRDIYSKPSFGIVLDSAVNSYNKEALVIPMSTIINSGEEF